MMSGENLTTNGSSSTGKVDEQVGNSKSGVDYSTNETKLIADDKNSAPGEKFLQIFRKNYGYYENEPQFCTSSLEEAMAVAWGPHEVRKLPLAIYLHNSNSIAVNIFVNNVLLDPEVGILLAKNFILWPWNCTEPENQKKLAELLSRVMPDVEHGVREIPPDNYPCICVYDKQLPACWADAQLYPRGAHQISGWRLCRPKAMNRPEFIKLLEINGSHNKPEVLHKLMNCMVEHWQALDGEAESSQLTPEKHEEPRNAMQEDLLPVARLRGKRQSQLEDKIALKKAIEDSLASMQQEKQLQQLEDQVLLEQVIKESLANDRDERRLQSADEALLKRAIEESLAESGNNSGRMKLKRIKSEPI